jgi:uncharacterized protein YdaT
MPWNAGDAARHTKKARSAKSKRQWSHVANSMLERGMSEGRAIRAANAVVKRSGGRSKRRSRRG